MANRGGLELGDAQPGPVGKVIARLLRPGLVANIGANGLGQVFQAVIQLLSVPVYAHALGLEHYGVWLLFATLPAYLVMSDFGLTVASGNDMTARVARGDWAGARSTFRTMCWSVLALAAAIGLIIVIVLGWVFPAPLAAAAQATGGKPFAVLCLILVYSGAVLLCSVSFAAFRAAGEYSVAAYRMHWISLVEAFAAMSMALAGQGLLAMAGALALTRLAGAAWLWWLLLDRQPQFLEGPGSSSGAGGVSLLRLSASAFVLQISHLLVLQGSVGTIGLLAGPAAVPAFTATRTVVRMALQVGMTVNNASLPGFTAAHARGEQRRMLDLIGLSAFAAVCTLVPAALLLVPLGSDLVAVWTSHRIPAPETLVLAMCVSMLAHGLWVPLSNFLLAINRQSTFSWHYLAIVLIALCAATVLVPRDGAVAMAWLVAAIDGLMLILILLRSAAAGLLDRQSLFELRHRTSAVLKGLKEIR